MKRLGENAAREALANGAKIREYDHLSINAGYRVMIDGEIAGYITFELFVKLIIDKTLSIEGSKRGFDHFEYASAQPETVTDAENAGEGAQEEENTMNETRTREQIAADIMGFFEDNESAFIECIEDIDNYNGYLGDDRYYEMKMLDEFFSGDEATEILRRAFYGHDEDTWHTDSRGEKEYSEFNPNREYFHFNGYGNLVSSNYKDYSSFNDIYLVQALSENRQHIDSVDRYDELSELFYEYENAEE